MPFPLSAAGRFFDLPPVNLQNLPLHLTKNSFASAPTHLCGIALKKIFEICAASCEGAELSIDSTAIKASVQVGRGIRKRAGAKHRAASAGRAAG